MVTDLSDQRYLLYRNNGDGTFTDATNPSGVGRATLKYSGWSTKFVDIDNDGWKDLFVAQGHVMDNIEVTSPNLKYLQPPLLLRNAAGPLFRRWMSDRPSRPHGPGAARRSAIWITTAISISSSPTSARRHTYCAMTAATRTVGSASVLAEESRIGTASDAASRSSRPRARRSTTRSRPRPAICPPATSDSIVGLGADKTREIRRDPLAVRRYPAFRERVRRKMDRCRRA